MSTTLPNMGLVQWNLGGDTFSHTELANNFAAIDNHDHTPGKGKLIPSAAITDGAITAPKLASGAVDSTKIAAGGINDDRLASPTNATYKTLFGPLTAVGPTTTGTFLLGPQGTLVPTGVDTTSAAVVLYLVEAEYHVPGLTTRLQLRATVLTNATAPGVSYTAALYPVTGVAGGAGNINYSVGGAVGSSVGFTTPGASSRNQNSSPDFVWPGDGYYALGVSVSGAPAANNRSIITTRLLRHNT